MADVVVVDKLEDTVVFLVYFQIISIMDRTVHEVIRLRDDSCFARISAGVGIECGL